MNLADMHAKSEKIAKPWMGDTLPPRITDTSMGPLDETGRSEAWNLTFDSPGGNASVTINTFRGMFTCYAPPGEAGRLPDLQPGFFRDGARLYAIAKEMAGNLIAEGYTVSVGTAAAPETRHATWYLHFEKADGKTAPRTILVDANNGAVEQVLD